jgi:biotin carboxylase
VTDALLLLLHQGKSFTREASAAAARHGLELVGLSSRAENPAVLEETRRHLADCIVTDGSRLGDGDIAGVLELFAERGYTVRAAVATFEGYRLLMAELNRQLGARDSAAGALRLCLNKYDLRRRLGECGLSAVQVHLLADGPAPALDPAARWFVKPVRGAGSFAAFILDDPRALGDLPALQQQMRSDPRMGAIFMDQYDFLVEEYVEGPEFSFEMVLADEPYYLCVHEKARVDRLERTTLESMSVSPPVTVGDDIIRRGTEFLSQCFKELRSSGLTAGVFHVEAKYWTARDRWEIIEINPRMGGSLINASVEILTGESVLSLWVESLTLPDEALDDFRARLAKASQLEGLQCPAGRKGTVFLSKYGKKGATVDSISFDPQARPPDILKIHVSAGTTLDDSDRAICLMDALWEVDPRILAQEADFLNQQAVERFHVTYR